MILNCKGHYRNKYHTDEYISFFQMDENTSLLLVLDGDTAEMVISELKRNSREDVQNVMFGNRPEFHSRSSVL